jgi:tetratricopeptide (TPR) repeat protein
MPASSSNQMGKVIDDISKLVEETSLALSNVENDAVRIHRDEIIQSMAIVLDPIRRDKKRVLARNIASIMYNIGNIWFAENEHETALSFYDRSYRMRKKIFGLKNLRTCMAAVNAGKCLHCLGRHCLALRYYNIFAKTVVSSKQFLTKETITVLRSLAWAFHQDHSFDHANRFYELALWSTKQSFGENNKEMSRTLNLLGNLKFEHGDFNSALECYEKSLRVEILNIERQKRKADVPIPESYKRYLDVLTTLSNIAQTSETIGNLRKSLSSMRKMLVILESPDCKASMPLSQVNRTVAKTLSHSARIFKKLGRFDQALRALTDVLRTQKQEYGPYHSLVAMTLNDMGVAHGSQGQVDLALQCFKESLDMRLLLKDSASNVSTVLCNIALVHYRNGDAKQAMLQYKKVVNRELSQRKSKSSVDLPLSSETLDALEQLAMIYQDDLDDPHEAIRCYEKGINLINESDFGDLSANALSRYLSMAGNTCLKLGDRRRASMFFTEAMRVNEAGGLAFNANIKVTGYEIHKVRREFRPSAPAA